MKQKSEPEVKAKTKSAILEAVHETASDLHRLGFRKRNMHKFDALCLAPVPDYSSEKSAHCVTSSN
jgi:putative transcriptional regulator